MMCFAFWAAAVMLLILFLVQPGRVSPQQEKPFRGRCYAHRGLYQKDQSIPENSLAAFAAAAEAGYGMELDVQLSKDGAVVVFHDDTLNRVTGIKGRVDEYTLEQLQKMPLCGTEHTMPLFKDVLACVAGRTPLIVELKSGRRNRELCQKTLALLREYEGVFCVESFDPVIVGWFKRNAPDILRGQLADSYKGYPHNPLAFLLSRCMGNWVSRPQFIAWGPRKKNVLVKLAESFGPMKVFWTAHDDEIHPHEELKQEYDAIIFEHYTPDTQY